MKNKKKNGIYFDHWCQNKFSLLENFGEQHRTGTYFLWMINDKTLVKLTFIVYVYVSLNCFLLLDINHLSRNLFVCVCVCVCMRKKHDLKRNYNDQTANVLLLLHITIYRQEKFLFWNLFEENPKTKWKKRRRKIWIRKTNKCMWCLSSKTTKSIFVLLVVVVIVIAVRKSIFYHNLWRLCSHL